MIALPTVLRVMSDGRSYRVPERFQPIKFLGHWVHGSYGPVSSFLDQKSGEKVAVQQMCVEELTDAKMILREIKLLKMIHHPSIVNMIDFFPPSNFPIEDVYTATDLMESDLDRVIASQQPLSALHHQYFIYQILAGLFYLHSANICHRDLKPSVILVNADCHIKICHFALVRGFEDEDEDRVVTRWYRAPEVSLQSKNYEKALDIWSVGCIFAELILRKPIFLGNAFMHQLKLIFHLLGPPSDEDLHGLEIRENTLRLLRSKFPEKEPKSLRKMFQEKAKPPPPDAAVELIEKMLTLDPKKRISAISALRHPVFPEELTEWGEEEIVKEAGWTVDWSFDDCEPSRLG